MKKRATDIRIKQLANDLAGVDPERLRMALMKTARIIMRVTETDKADMQAAAQDAGLTLTEYLTRLHYAARGCFGIKELRHKGSKRQS